MAAMAKPGEPFFSAILVAWESGQDLPGCIGALAAARERAAAAGLGVELIVVDNGSADFTLDSVSRLWPDARVIVNPDNRGFAVAANQGARLASGTWLLLLNPDVGAEGDPLTAMAEYARAHPEVVAIAPRLLSPGPECERQDDFQLRRLPTLGSLVRDALLLDHVWRGNRWRTHERYLDVNRDATFEVEQPAASALAVRRDVFTACGGFDEAYTPAWFEDVDLASRLRCAGRIVYLPASRFVHAGGTSAKRLGFDKFLPLFHRNGLRYWRTHRGKSGARAYRASLVLGMVVRLAALAVASGPHPRDEAARAYLAVLRGALGLDPSWRFGHTTGTPLPAPPRTAAGRHSRLVWLARGARRVMAEGGLAAVVRRVLDHATGRHRPVPASAAARYAAWLADLRVTPRARALFAAEAAGLGRRTTFSILMPVHDPPLAYLREAVDSVRAQLYQDWELCIADDASSREVAAELEALAAREPRIRLVRSGRNLGISGATNLAMELARGDWVGFLDHDDVLDPAALALVAREIETRPALDAVYTDRDTITEDGARVDPYFKPDWSPAALLSHNYAIHFLTLRRDLLARLGGLRGEYDGAQDHDLLLRLSELTDRVGHVPHVLYSWRRHPGSNALTPRPAAFEAGRRTIIDALHRLGLAGEVALGGPAGPFRTRIELRSHPLVSVIVSTIRVDLLRECTRSLLERSSYDNLEILVATNAVEDARLRAFCAEQGYPLVEVRDGFFSAMNNAAAERARGEYVLFLNDDMEVRSPAWIEEMLGLCQLPGVVAVGPRLVYPDGRTQFTRAVTGIRRDGLPYFFDPFDHWGVPYLFGHSLEVATEVASVSGGCMICRRADFLRSGGFDHGTFRFSYQDVDWSMRVRASGGRIVFTPHAEVVHYGSVSKRDVPDMMEREVRLVTAFVERHEEALRRGDPYFSPNLLDVHGLLEPPCFPGLGRRPIPEESPAAGHSLAWCAPFTEGGDAQAEATGRAACRAFASRLRDLLHPCRVADVGCGHGLLVEALLEAGVEAWGLDRSRAALAAAPAAVRSVMMLGDITAPASLADLGARGLFDVVVATFVLERLPGEALPGALGSLARLARIVVLTSPIPNAWDLSDPSVLSCGDRRFWLAQAHEAGLSPSRRLGHALFGAESDRDPDVTMLVLERR